MGKQMTINISPERFVELGHEIDKGALIADIIEGGFYHDRGTMDWMKEVLEKEIASANPSREVVFPIVETVSEFIHEEEARALLTRVFRQSEEKSAGYDAVKSVLMAALVDEIDRVRQWAIDTLKSKDELKSGDDTEVEEYLIGNLRDEANAGALRESAATALGPLCTEGAAEALLSIMRELLGTRAHADPHSGLVEGSLMRAVAHSLGATASNFNLPQTLEAWRLLDEMRRGEDDEDVQQTAAWAIGEIVARMKEPLTLIAVVGVSVKTLQLAWALLDRQIRAAADSESDDALNILKTRVLRAEDDYVVLELTEFAGKG